MARAWILLCVGCIGWLGWLATAPAAAGVVVYDDSLHPDFQSWSWENTAGGNVAFDAAAPTHTGDAAIWFLPRDWSGLSIYGPFDAATHPTLELWLHGGGAGGQQLEIRLEGPGGFVGSALELEDFVPGEAIPANGWVKATVPFAAFGTGGASFHRVDLMQRSAAGEEAVYIDDVVLVGGPPPGPVTVSVDPGAGRRPIDPRIYGVNFGAFPPEAPDVPPYPVRRWGGNVTTRYNWETDVANHASDWFFISYEEEPGPGNAADSFVAQTFASGGEPLVTVPTIGWKPRMDLDMGDPVRWSFSRAKYDDPPGQVQTNDEYLETGGQSWAAQDAGNGLFADDPPVYVVNDPSDVSEPSDPADATAWLDHIAAQRGGATAGDPGGVRLYALDNEIMLWHSTHRDVRREANPPHAMLPPVDAAELWQRTVAYAGALKAHDPQVELFGPVTWGWCDLFYSAADGCAPGLDHAAHGDLLPWYLRQVKAHADASGVRLVDWIDLHYYPQVPGVSLSSDESPAVAANRLASIKSLYDPTYKEPSWIGRDLDTAVSFLPRIRTWRTQEQVEGMRIAITEYNWGDGDGDGVLAGGRSDMNGMSSALAQAEVLAVFGREGVDLATRWVAPLPGSRIEDAFRMYLDWDTLAVPGMPRIDGETAQAVSSAPDRVSAYAIVGTGDDAGRLFLLLFNKATVTEEDVAIAFPAGTLAGGPASTYRLDATGYHQVAASLPAGQTLTLDLPARTATLVVLATSSDGSTGADFYTVDPCRLVDTRSVSAPALADGVTRTFALAGQCGIPGTARALSLNLTVAGATGGGFVVAWPADAARPGTSVVNFAVGRVRANNAVIAVSGDGQARLSAFAAVAGGGQVDLIVDVTGYFE